MTTNPTVAPLTIPIPFPANIKGRKNKANWAYGQGYGVWDIADALGVTVRTVRNYVRWVGSERMADVAEHRLRAMIEAETDFDKLMRLLAIGGRYAKPTAEAAIPYVVPLKPTATNGSTSAGT